MAQRTYRKDDLLVHWDSTRCIHVASCLRAAPQVFDVHRRPWVVLDAATPEEIVAAVERCPTGALRWEKTDGTREQPPARTTVVALPRGPLLMRGDLEVRNPKGEVIAHETRLALCRCGKTENAPFCDNSHRKSGFAQKPRAEHAEAEAPDKVCPPQEF